MHRCCARRPHPSRRAVLGVGGALFAWAFMPRLAVGRRRPRPPLRRVVLRGALDGLAAVPPVGDPDYAALRGGSRSPRTGDGRRPFRSTASSPCIRRCRSWPGSIRARQALDRPRGRHALSRALAFRRPGRAGERPARARPASNPAGSTAPIAALPQGDARRRARRRSASARSPPLVMRGAAPVLGWAPQTLPQAERRSRRAACSTSTARRPGAGPGARPRPGHRPHRRASRASGDAGAAAAGRTAIRRA